MADLSEILGAVNTGLRVLKQVSDLPGVNALPYVNTLSTAVTALQAAIEAGQNVAPYITAITDTFKDGGSPPTEEQLAALDARIDELRAGLQEPLPEAEEGETD